MKYKNVKMYKNEEKPREMYIFSRKTNDIVGIKFTDFR